MSGLFRLPLPSLISDKLWSLNCRNNFKRKISKYSTQWWVINYKNVGSYIRFVHGVTDMTESLLVSNVLNNDQ